MYFNKAVKYTNKKYHYLVFIQNKYHKKIKCFNL